MPKKTKEGESRFFCLRISRHYFELGRKKAQENTRIPTPLPTNEKNPA